MQACLKWESVQDKQEMLRKKEMDPTQGGKGDGGVGEGGFEKFNRRSLSRKGECVYRLTPCFYRV